MSTTRIERFKKIEKAVLSCNKGIEEDLPQIETEQDIVSRFRRAYGLKKDEFMYEVSKIRRKPHLA